MSGHSKWASIKHSKGKADKQRSKIFSKLSKEISVAAKLGDQDPEYEFKAKISNSGCKSRLICQKIILKELLINHQLTN